jgi:MFS family permease
MDRVANAAASAPVAAAPPASERRSARFKGIKAADLRKSLRYSILDGAWWSVMHGAGERYVVPFVIIAGSQIWPVAAFQALPPLAGALVQWLAANVTDRTGHRQRICVVTGLIQAATWLPICLAIFMPQPAGFYLMLSAYIVYVAMQNFSMPPWFSWIGDLVPVRTRGSYFGLRGMLTGFVTLTAFMAAGRWVDWAGTVAGLGLLGLESQNFAFLVIFAIAGLARVVSVRYLQLKVEPKYVSHRQDRFSLVQFVRRMPRAHFGRFVLYSSSLHAAGMLLGPAFLSWYLLRELEFTPTQYAVVFGLNLVLLYGGQQFWGRVADRIGAKQVITLCGWASVVIPLLYLVSPSFWWVALVFCYDGFVFAGLGIGSANYVYDVVTPAKRARCSAFRFLFVGMGGLIGTTIGASILSGLAGVEQITILGVEFTSEFHVLLVTSALLRVLPNLLLPTFAEFRLKPKPWLAAARGSK